MSSSLFQTNSPLIILLQIIIAHTLYSLYWQLYYYVWVVYWVSGVTIVWKTVCKNIQCPNCSYCKKLSEEMIMIERLGYLNTKLIIKMCSLKQPFVKNVMLMSCKLSNKNFDFPYWGQQESTICIRTMKLTDKEVFLGGEGIKERKKWKRGRREINEEWERERRGEAFLSWTCLWAFVW